MGVHAKISERLAPRFKIVQISSRERLLGKYRINVVHLGGLDEGVGYGGGFAACL